MITLRSYIETGQSQTRAINKHSMVVRVNLSIVGSNCMQLEPGGITRDEMNKGYVYICMWELETF